MQLLSLLALSALATASPLVSRQTVDNTTTIVQSAPTSFDGTTDVDMASVYTCGDQPYLPEAYTCYADGTLCPVVSGRRQRSCGGACYDPALYGCTDGVLQQVTTGGTYLNGTAADMSAVAGSVYPVNGTTLANSTGSYLRYRA